MPSKWETVLLCNDISHWLGASLESALVEQDLQCEAHPEPWQCRALGCYCFQHQVPLLLGTRASWRQHSVCSEPPTKDRHDSKCKLIKEYFNKLILRQNGHHFPDDILKCIFLNDNGCMSIKISLKFGPRGPINNIPSLVQIMARYRWGEKPLSEPMLVRLLVHIWVTRPQCVKKKTRNCRSVIYYDTPAP